ncbi:MAG: AsmA-like C-terminal region-containing protein [Hyphomicrobiaceae bacterium]
MLVRQNQPSNYQGQRRAPHRNDGSGDMSEYAYHLDEEPWWYQLLCRLFFCCGMVFGPIVLLALLAAGIGYFRLSQGPVALPFLTERIQNGIRAEFSGLTPTISDVVVALNDDYSFEFQLQELKLRDNNGSVVASAPSAAIGLSASALMSGRVVPSRVELIEPRLFLFYSDAAGLSLSFSTPTGDPKLVTPPQIAKRPAQGTRDNRDAKGQVATDPDVPLSQSQRLDLGRILSQVASSARRGDDASRHLREFGLRDATLVLDYNGERSVWKVPSFAVDVEHRPARSIVTGNGRISSALGPWTMTFRAESDELTNTVNAKASIRDLHPRTLVSAFPELAALKAVELPVSGDVTVAMTSAGEVVNADLDLAVARGRIILPAKKAKPLQIDAGRMNFIFDGSKKLIELRPSVLRSGDSQLQLTGLIQANTAADGTRQWPFEIKATDGWFGLRNVNETPLPIEEWQANGRMLPDEGMLHLDRFVVKAGGGGVEVQGKIDVASKEPTSQLIGKFSPMELRVFKAMWPKPLAPDAWDWVNEKVRSGRMTGGQFSYYAGRFLKEAQPGYIADDGRLSMAMEFSEVTFQPMGKMFPVVAPRALLRLENDALEVVAPDAEMVVDDTQRVALKLGRFTAVQLETTVPQGELTFKARSKLQPLLQVLDQPPLNLFKKEGGRPENVSGNVESEFKLSFPLLKDIKLEAVVMSGKAKLTNGQAKDLIGSFDVQGASIDFDVTQQVLEAKGNMLVGGVPADVSWSNVFSDAIEKQPPILVKATLDRADRKLLGLEMGEAVSGSVPVQLTVVRGQGGEKNLKIAADLTAAEVNVPGAGWKKPAGRRARLEADVGQGADARTELQNFTIRGDKIAVEGWIALDNKNNVSEFFFPLITLDVVTQMKAQGRKRRDGIWRVQVEGPTFNGQGFFSSLFSLSKSPASATSSKKRQRGGIDLTANFNTVIGYSDQTLRGLKVTMSRRGGLLTALDAKGTLESGKPLIVKLVDGNGVRRQLRADSTDAGRAFKLIGFYPNVNRGRVRLEVNLDGSGAAEQTGVLWVENFQILSDPIVSEVVGSGKGNKKSRRREVREVYDFDRMKAPFSVGHDQFVLKESYLRGPLIGATIRGKVDYRVRRLDLFGTYIPLQGLNNALGEIPLLGTLISGPRGEGIFGITFEIDGAMSNPNVVVNPLSLVTPGIFREIFQTAPNNPTVQPRAPRGRNSNGTIRKRTRSSSAPAKSGNAWRSSGPKASQGNIDGWSSQTSGGR